MSRHRCSCWRLSFSSVPPFVAASGDEHGDHFLEAVVHGQLPGRSLVDIADSGPPAVGDEVARRDLLVQPGGAAELQVNAHSRLQESDHRAVELLDEEVAADAGHLYLAVEAEGGIGPGDPSL